MRAARTLVVALALGFATTARSSVFEPREFTSADHERSYRALIEELRCLVCQNQNVADSDADLAADLRREVYEQLEAGKSEDEILAFMTERYGDFVLYRPPLKATTVALWAGPFALAVLGGIVLLVRLRRGSPRSSDAATGDSLDAPARERLAALTGEEPPR